jgi:hypothetical protein
LCKFFNSILWSIFLFSLTLPPTFSPIKWQVKENIKWDADHNWELVYWLFFLLFWGRIPKRNTVAEVCLLCLLFGLLVMWQVQENIWWDAYTVIENWFIAFYIFFFPCEAEFSKEKLFHY